MKTRSLFVGLALVGSVFLIEPAFSYDSIKICNKGNTDLRVVRAANDGWGGIETSGWYLVKPGRCSNLRIDHYTADKASHWFGFAIENRLGQFGAFGHDGDWGWNSVRMKACVDPYEAFERTTRAGAFNSGKKNLGKNCPQGWVAMPLAVRVDDMQVRHQTINVDANENLKVYPLTEARNKKVDSSEGKKEDGQKLSVTIEDGWVVTTPYRCVTSDLKKEVISLQEEEKGAILFVAKSFAATQFEIGYLEDDRSEIVRANRILAFSPEDIGTVERTDDKSPVHCGVIALKCRDSKACIFSALVATNFRKKSKDQKQVLSEAKTDSAQIYVPPPIASAAEQLIRTLLESKSKK